MKPGATPGVKSKEDAQSYLKRGIEFLAEMQDKLYAQDQWGVLLIFQAMDAAGKDGAIKHVMSGINPQGCQVFSFKAPSAEELDHDFLWRTSRCLPERGRIGIFNRSYYEEVLVVRVHPEILEKQKLPRQVRHEAHLGGAVRGHPGLRALPGAPGLRDPQVLPARLEQGAEGALPRAPRSAGEELEVLDGRREGAGPLERLHEGVRGADPRDGDAARALVRGARRQEVVHAPRGGRRGPRRPREAAPRLPEGGRGQEEGARGGAGGAGRRREREGKK